MHVSAFSWGWNVPVLWTEPILQHSSGLDPSRKLGTRYVVSTSSYWPRDESSVLFLLILFLTLGIRWSVSLWTIPWHVSLNIKTRISLENAAFLKTLRSPGLLRFLNLRGAGRVPPCPSSSRGRGWMEMSTVASVAGVAAKPSPGALLVVSSCCGWATFGPDEPLVLVRKGWVFGRGCFIGFGAA